jgi:tripartite ATP-independent transporter DctP family solute receptor
MKKMTKRIYLYLALVLVVGMAISISCLASEPRYVIKLASGNSGNPMAMPASAGVNIFAQKVEEYSDGQAVVKVFPDGQLGDQVSCLQQVKSGQIQIVELAADLLSNIYPPMGFVSLPYLLPNLQVAGDILKRDNPFVKGLLSKMAAKSGVSVLTFYPQSCRQITNNKRLVKTVDDLKGLKIRTMQVKPHIAMFNATGAQAVPIPWLETYTSLQTGVVDGEENPLSTIKQSNFQEVQRYMTLTNHVLLIGGLAYNVKWFNSLPTNIRLALVRAGDESSVGVHALAILYDRLIYDEFVKKGIKLYTPTAKEIAGFKKVMQPAAFKWYYDNVPDGKQLLKQLDIEVKIAEKNYNKLL